MIKNGTIVVCALYAHHQIRTGSAPQKLVPQPAHIITLPTTTANQLGHLSALYSK